MATITGTPGDDFITDTFINDGVSGPPTDFADSISGGGGNDSIAGAGGNDTIAGDDGNDTLDGTGADDLLEGGDGNDSLLTAGGADTLRGGAGADTLSALGGSSGLTRLEGGSGNDIYAAFAATTVVVELADGGIDLLEIRADNVVLPDHVENGLLQNSPLAITAFGNALDNILTGNGLNNVLHGAGGNDQLFGGVFGTDTLDGGDGADTLDGGNGADSLAGGAGDDLYLVDAAGDGVFESGGGIDQVNATVSHTLTTDVENLLLLGADSLTGTGNALDNRITGNGGANTLSGADGADTLVGGGGADRLDGGSGNDVYEADSTDVLVDSDGIDTVRTGASHALGVAFENLVLLGIAALTGTGNASANLMVANDAGNTLIGNDGADTLLGGAGHDSLSGGPGGDRLEGGDGADTLNGLTDNDTTIGGQGDDVHVVGQAADVVIEQAGGGTDTVRVTAAFTGSYVLPNNVENLEILGAALLPGTGNALDNAITGNSAANALSGLGGADTLDGAGGADSLVGGLGNDVYVVNDLGDAVSEAGGDGVDLVLAGVSFTLGAGVENLTLTGGGGIAGTGNGLANLIIGNDGSNVLAGGGNADTLVGQGGNDVLNGGAGADSMAGAGNSDRYTVDDAGDVVVEDAVAGVDVVSSFVDWVLGSNVEQLNLLGTALNGFGNGLANRIAGNAMDNLLVGFTGNDRLLGDDGADTLVGGPGRDAMTGGNGADRFLFNAPDEGVDGIDDFAPGVDQIAVAGANFGGLPAGPLAALNFVAHASNATTSGAGVPQFIYNTTTGALFFDADGTGGADAVRLVNLGGAPALAASDIVLV
ncbi:MAG: calcium-binding protein [Alphaproteobacteria bacterium]|nr:calcium-binding protein [Alphaproteobacteria bacterium]